MDCFREALTKTGLQGQLLALRPNKKARTVLYYYLKYQGKPQVQKLCALFHKTLHSHLLLANKQGRSPLAGLSPRPKVLGPLLNAIEKIYDLALTLGFWRGSSSLGEAYVRKYINERFPDDKDRLKLVLTKKALYGGSLCWSMLGEERHSALLMLLGDGPTPYVPPGLEKLHELLSPRIESVKKSLVSATGGATVGELKTRLQQLYARQKYLYLCIHCAELSKEDVATLTPLFLRIQGLADPDLAKALTRFVLCYKTGDIPKDWLEAALKGKRALLHLLPLSWLLRRGLSRDLVQQVHKRIYDANRRYYEGSTEGKAVLEAWVVISRLRYLSAEGLKHLIGSMLAKDFVSSCVALTQICSMGRDDLLTEPHLDRVKGELTVLAQECFFSWVPMKKIDDFHRRFERCFGGQRYPESLLTYASKLVDHPRVLRELGDWVYSVLRGSFHAERYRADQSEHMVKLYELAPRLKELLPKLCKTLGKESVMGGLYTVELTDDHWDLFRIGSDVNGSCQHVNKSVTYNKSLLGYVIDGKTFAIVIKKPGSPRIIARRLLRIELDQEKKRPVLFLERLYSNRQSSTIDIAIAQMAANAARHLQLPLYSKSVSGGSGETTLHSLGSPATWVYADGGPGMTDGSYCIPRARLLFDPSTAKL